MRGSATAVLVSPLIIRPRVATPTRAIDLMFITFLISCVPRVLCPSPWSCAVDVGFVATGDQVTEAMQGDRCPRRGAHRVPASRKVSGIPMSVSWAGRLAYLGAGHCTFLPVTDSIGLLF